MRFRQFTTTIPARISAAPTTIFQSTVSSRKIAPSVTPTGGITYVTNVVRIAPQADKETREVLVDVGIDNLPKSWAIGQRAEVYIETTRKENALMIPQNAVVWRQQQAGVFVVDRGRTYWRQILLGIEGRQNVEVLKGLQPDQVVLIPGSKLPRDGRAVKAIAE